MNDEKMNVPFERIPLAVLHGHSFILWHYPDAPTADAIVIIDKNGKLKGLFKNEGKHMDEV